MINAIRYIRFIIDILYSLISVVEELASIVVRNSINILNLPIILDKAVTYLSINIIEYKGRYLRFLGYTLYYRNYR